MPREPRKYLHDVLTAASRITTYTDGYDTERFEANDQLRSAVERQFEIIGEALAQLKRLDPTLAARIPEAPRIVAFRNLLIHGYASIDSRIVWDIVITKLPSLLRTVVELLADPGGSADA
jgi:uncharacterized protein with HEPN domain